MFLPACGKKPDDTSVEPCITTSAPQTTSAPEEPTAGPESTIDTESTTEEVPVDVGSHYTFRPKVTSSY